MAKGKRVHTFILFSFINHPLNLLLGQPTLIVGNSNLIRLAGSLVCRRDVQNTISVHIKRHLDLRNTTRSGRDTGKVEFAEEVVVFRANTLTLEDVDQDTGLVVGVC